MLGSLQAGLMRKPSSSAFVPTDIAGCKLWLRGDLGITQSGGLVSAWADQSGNGNNVAEATLKPAFTASSINGQPGVTFDASGVFLGNTSTNLITAGAARTVYVICKPAGTNGVRVGGTPFCFRLGVAGVDQCFVCFLMDLSGSYFYCGDMVNFNDTGTTGPSAATPYVYEESTNGSVVAVKLNHSAITLNSTTSPNDNSSNPGFRVGKRGDSNFPFDGDIDEILVYDTNLGSTDRASLDTYFLGRYGI